MQETQQKNIATFIHLSTFSRFIIPLGNFIGPLILWIANRDKSEFINNHGKQAINFQLSVLFYTIIIGTISIPFFIFNLFNGFNGLHFSLDRISPLLIIGGGLGVLAVVGYLIELVFVIQATIKARDGEHYQYPLSIHFIK